MLNKAIHELKLIISYLNKGDIYFLKIGLKNHINLFNIYLAIYNELLNMH